MSRRVIQSFFAVVLSTSLASAATTGFDADLEEPGHPYPPVNLLLNFDFAAPVGTFRILTEGNISYSDNDPVSGVGCDPTTFHTMLLDASTFSAHMRMEFPMTALAPVVFDRIITGTSHQGSEYGASWGVYSGTSRHEEVILQYGPNRQLLIYGQPVDIGGGQFLEYNDLWTNDCAAGIDHHFDIRAFHNFAGGDVRVELLTHGSTGRTYILGPFPMSPQVISEGIAGQFARQPGGTGLGYFDGMVCNGQNPVITSQGGDEQTGTRGR